MTEPSWTGSIKLLSSYKYHNILRSFHSVFRQECGTINHCDRNMNLESNYLVTWLKNEKVCQLLTAVNFVLKEIFLCFCSLAQELIKWNMCSTSGKRLEWQNITEVRELGYKFFITGAEYLTCVELRTSSLTPSQGTSLQLSSEWLDYTKPSSVVP